MLRYILAHKIVLNSTINTLLLSILWMYLVVIFIKYIDLGFVSMIEEHPETILFFLLPHYTMRALRRRLLIVDIDVYTINLYYISTILPKKYVLI